MLVAKRNMLVTALSFVGLVGCDHGTKIVAKAELEGQTPTVLIRDVLDLTYRENHGIAFSLERVVPEAARLPLYVVFTTVVLVAVAVAWWRRRRERSWEAVGLTFIAAGAIGNLSDRIARGYVVDFVHVHGWPVFNAADVWIGVGVGALIVGAFLAWRRRRPPSVPGAAT